MAGPLREQAIRAAGGDVRLLGARDDVPALLAAADVVVVPSRWEARALIVQEAMLAGRPIVATRVGGVPELTGEDGAVLVEPDDPAAIAAAVTAVLDDPALAARLGGAARARAASFPSEEDALTEMLARYAHLAASRSQAR
jgi:glycosyltransferase involved in cell wall biosynthesis